MKLFFTTLLALLFTTFAFAQDGTLDTSFGDNGYVVIDADGSDTEILSITQSSDRIVAVGYSGDGAQQKMAVQAFNLDGSLDSGFGTSGSVEVPSASGAALANVIVQQPDGKYIIAGWARTGNKDLYVLLRLTADGQLDTSFGTDGFTKGFFSSSSFAEDEIAAIRLLSDGKIVVAGRSYGGLLDDAFVACFNSDGSLFTDFGTNGFSIIQFDISPEVELATALDVDAQDNIYIGGRMATNFNDEDGFFILKLNKLGVPDNSFGVEGVAFKILAPNIVAGLNDIAVDAQGRIVTGGGAFNTSELDNEFFLTRYLPNGNIDNSFGDNGLVILQRGDNESIFDLEILSNGNIIAAGSTGGFGSEFAIVRLSDEGTHDTSFGNNGWALTQIETNFNGIASIVVDEDCIYAGGFARGADNYSMALAKYKNEGVASAVNGLETTLGLSLFPNPAISEFSIEFELIKQAQLSIVLINNSGQLVQILAKEQKLKSGFHQYNFAKPEGLAPGVYWLELKTENEVISRQLQF